MASTRPRNLYTEEKLRPAVAASTSYHDVMRHLGLPVTGGGSAHISRRIKDFGIDVSHFTSLRPPPEPLRPLGREELDSALAQARSLADLARRWAYRPRRGAGGTFSARSRSTGSARTGSGFVGCGSAPRGSAPRRATRRAWSR